MIGTREQRSCTFNWSDLNLCAVEAAGLDNCFTEEEIHSAILQMPTEKAPGPDGFTGTFCRMCWPIIKSDVLRAFCCLHSLTTGPLHKLNGASIALLPKKVDAESVGDYRPISLIHSFAKIVSKVLALRLAPKLGDLVSASQSAFVKKRCIQDNLLYVRNLARAYHRTRTPALLLKLDISKAFDSVSWEYLFELLQIRVFPTRWRNWLALILSSSSSSVLLNGVAGDAIVHKRGLRQGDPLSPYLLILAIDSLQRLFELATEEGFLSPLRGRYAKLRLSLYADDAVIFINPLKQDVDMTIRLMQRFGDATGLRINLSKSSVAAIRCQDVDLDSILSSFSGQRVEFPITYLGMPLSVGRLRLVHLELIKDKAVAKLSGWQCKLLSPGGRRVLVRSVLSSLPVYLLTVIKSPKVFIKDFDKIRRRFLWAGNQQLHGGKCKVSWVRLQWLINRGGLGIINLELFSRALRLRWLWFEWKCPEKPWVGMELPIDDTDRALFAAATRVTVNNGQRAKFWHSSWINGASPALLFPELFKHSKRKNRTVAEALRDDNWIRDILHDLTVGLLSEYTQLWELVESVHFNHESAAEDTITWTRTASCEYSASSAYKMQFEGEQGLDS
ncbi:hypothetical protein U9M48_018397 [Paspalum notatum var. saurae]|uniref:Reverse transcriptase domain-containing protein n=1 Tax=Paspalum notatum var. saurae TaxID=547442 RepID=A0AAQ3TA41_PASNO